MSMLLMVKAMQVKVGNPMRKLVLIKLADNANDMGECWPSYQHIADHCEMDRSTVRRHIKALEKSGLVKIENRQGPKGNSSNLYILNLDSVGTVSTGVGTKSTPVGSTPTPLVGTVSTRTSHSIEPVNEPIQAELSENLHIGKPTHRSANDHHEGTFESFWKSYPRKTNKKGALKVWFRIKPDDDLLKTIMSAVAKQKRSSSWVKDNGKFIPHASTWLNNERWTDEVDEADYQAEVMSDTDDYMMGI